MSFVIYSKVWPPIQSSTYKLVCKYSKIVVLFYKKYIIMNYIDVNSFSDVMREKLKVLEMEARRFIDELKLQKKDWEVIAQATLAMRLIEDSRMRYGKVIQYLGDWVSIYDIPNSEKETVREEIKW